MQWLLTHVDPARHVLTEEEERAWEALDDQTKREGESEQNHAPNPALPIHSAYQKRCQERINHVQARQDHLQGQFHQLG